jgi:hypothetical protein
MEHSGSDEEGRVAEPLRDDCSSAANPESIARSPAALTGRAEQTIVLRPAFPTARLNSLGEARHV